MKIGSREIGPGHPPYVIAEIGVNHDGEVARALELTQAAAEAGADAVKLQYFETDRLLSKAAKLAAYQKAAGETDPVAMLRRLELSLDEMAQVVDLAHELGIHAIVTVFSVELVKPASELAWDAYKSASPDVINRPLLESLAATGKPLIVSTGASTLDEVVRAVGWLEAIRERLAVLQCVSSYPTFEEHAAIGGIEALRDASIECVGYSDHTTRVWTGWIATGAGACMLEKHLTYARFASGPDHKASLEPEQFAEYADSSRKTDLFERVPRSSVTRFGVDKLTHLAQTGQSHLSLLSVCADGESDLMVRWNEDDEYCDLERDQVPFCAYPVEKVVQDCERDVRAVARQSMTTTRDMTSGETITRSDLTIKRPGTGIEPFRLDEVIGKRLARSVDADTPLVEDDLAD